MSVTLSAIEHALRASDSKQLSRLGLYVAVHTFHESLLARQCAIEMLVMVEAKR